MAVLATLALLFAAVFAVCCLLLAAFIGSLPFMVVLNHRLRERGLDREEELLATPLPHTAPNEISFFDSQRVPVPGNPQ